MALDRDNAYYDYVPPVVAKTPAKTDAQMERELAAAAAKPTVATPTAVTATGSVNTTTLAGIAAASTPVATPTPTPTNTVGDPLKDKNNKPVAPTGSHYTWIGGTTTGSWVLYKDPTTVSVGGGGGGNGSNTPVDTQTYTASDGHVFTDQMAFATYQASLDNNKAQADLLKKQQQGATTTALEDFKANLKLAGLDSLADTIDGYIKQDLTAAQVKINIIGTQAYKDRFPGMDALRSKGLAVSEGTYIAMERGYDQTLRAYGLDANTLATTARKGTWIANEVSPAEFENRVSIAADRVSKNTDVLGALQTYYGITAPTAITWLLDPSVGMALINKEIRAAEIGAAAQNAGWKNFGAGVAESFVNASGKEDLTALKTDFQKAYQLAGVQSRLASIEGEDVVGKDISAIKAVLGQDQNEILESQKRAARETARFGGNAGVNSYSLRGPSGI